jgi:hypothetical protein
MGVGNIAGAVAGAGRDFAPPKKMGRMGDVGSVKLPLWELQKLDSCMIGQGF